MEAIDVRYIFLHCSAGFGSIEAVKKYWREKLGWKDVGYHTFIDEDGEKHHLAPYNQVVNGVKYYNRRALHLSYKGGVERTNYKKAKDTRTLDQKKSIFEELFSMLEYLEENGCDLCKLQIKGHRDISPDKNLNGRVDANERIKECPSFDAIPEYSLVIDNFINKRPLNYK